MTTYFKPATNEQAYLKAGIRGFEKSGKTFTATSIAIGLHKYIQSKKPVTFIDTETGSSYVLDRFKEEGIELLTIKSRAFVDLMGAMKEAEKVSDILIIDSISHFWTELVDAYMEKLGRERLRIWDWAPIKQEWHGFSDLYVNSKLHIIMCGRAGWEYEDVEDEDGVMKSQKTGTKMKAETETGFEPSLLIEMERTRAKDGSLGQTIKNRAWIVGDRFDQINGKMFDMPTFDSFLPHIKRLNLGGNHVGVDVASSSKDLFTSPSSRSDEFKKREIYLEELKDELKLRFPGRSDADRQAVIKILRLMYGTSSETALAQLQAGVLHEGLKKLRAFSEELGSAEILSQLESEKIGEEAIRGAD